MILADKIVLFRKKNGWSQEEFAEKMGVSRQSVSKWEGAQSIPELDKILLMARIFGVSTDFLLKDELEEAEYVEERENDAEGEVCRISMEEASSYLAAVKETAPKIAFGVSLCILSPVALIFLIGCAEAGKLAIGEGLATGIGLTALILLVAAAVALFVVNGIKLDEYDRWEKEILELEYGVAGMVKERQKQEKDSFIFRIAAGITLCVLSPLPLFLSLAFGEDPFIEIVSVCLLLIMVAVGVFLIVVAAIKNEATEKLLQEGDYTQKAKRQENKLSPLSGIYWCLVTAIYLGISFYFMNWERSWIIWPVAGVLFVVIWEIAKLFCKDKK